MIEHFHETLPFVALASATPVKLSPQRIIEAVFIAIISAAVSTYVMVRVLDERTQELTKRMDRLESSQDTRYSAIQEDVRRIYAILVEARAQNRTAR